MTRSPSWRIELGDCLERLRCLEEASVDSVVTDPPYGLGFMGKAWDAIPPGVDVAAELLRVLKPGGHVLAFGGTRTFHRLAVALEDAGFEIRDSLAWLYGQGFPKSLDVSKALDRRRVTSGALRRLQGEIRRKRLELGLSQSEVARRIGMIGPDERLPGGGFVFFETGLRIPTAEQYRGLRELLGLSSAVDAAFVAAEREVVGSKTMTTNPGFGRNYYADTTEKDVEITVPATDAAKAWAGWGTALKPAFEPVVVARKPLEGTVAANVLEHGTGAINVDGCRIEGTKGVPASPCRTDSAKYGRGSSVTRGGTPGFDPNAGRWPANVLLDEEAARLLDEQTGDLGRSAGRGKNASSGYGGGFGDAKGDEEIGFGDRGGASRFFYVAKASKRERNEGLPEWIANRHPTVKPVAVMRWLVRLVTPPGGLALDPFLGSGTTGVAAIREGFRFLGIEKDEESLLVAGLRVWHAAQATRALLLPEAA